MLKKILGGIMLVWIISAASNLKAANDPVPICITPAFEFRCFIDKFSLPGMLTVMAGYLSFRYLHKSITSYIHRKTTPYIRRQTTPRTNNDLVSEDIMVAKAKNFAMAAATLAAITAALYFRVPIKSSLRWIPHLLRC